MSGWGARCSITIRESSVSLMFQPAARSVKPVRRAEADAHAYVLLEEWASATAWERHMATPHVAAFEAVAGKLTESTDLVRLARLT